jgi:Uncharacterized conserved protein (DUF2183)
MIMESDPDNKNVTFYPTYGFKQDSSWVIPIRLWVSEPRSLLQTGLVNIGRLVDSLGADDPSETDCFSGRIRHFVADSKSREKVEFSFDDDPAEQLYRAQNSKGKYPHTNKNGFIGGTITLPTNKARELLQRQGSSDGWLTYRARSDDHHGVGRVRLLEPNGLSVISDIDDTIKITEILAGKKTVIKNTFFREYMVAPGMADKYREWKDAAFHYVSGGPWQLYRPLSDFLFSPSTGFPEGSFHMRTLTKNLTSMQTWKGLAKLVSDENLTFSMKVAYISEIMRRFPGRKFVLVGDSGEKDPEVYQAIKKAFSEQVLEIWIRDVSNDRVSNRSRLEGMRIIEA